MSPLERDPWFPLCKPRDDARLRLFCFPFAGGGASVFRSWPMFLPEDVEVRAVQPPGRENRTREAPLGRVEELVEALVPVVTPLLDRPFALFGHSLGALVAFELSLALAAQGARAPLRLFVSGAGAPHLHRSGRRRAELPDEELIGELAGLGGTPPGVLEHRGLVQIFLPLLRADFGMSEGYRASPDVRVGCPLSIFLSEGDGEVSPRRAHAWAEVAPGEVRTRTFDGDHFFLQSAQEAVCAAVAEDLAA